MATGERSNSYLDFLAGVYLVTQVSTSSTDLSFTGRGARGRRLCI